jgi:thioredoxin-related protein
MKRISKNIITLMLMISWISLAAQERANIYDPTADAAGEIEKALETSRDVNKNVLLMIGGNWCPWCIKLNGFIMDDFQVDSTLQSNYVWVKVNYSKENKNLDLLKRLGFPQRMGFPVFVVLDQEGNRLHTQNSWYLEKEKSYDRDKLMAFLRDWGPAALDPSSYKDYR